MDVGEVDGAVEPRDDDAFGSTPEGQTQERTLRRQWTAGLGRARDAEGVREADDDLAIPDYVMRDFGSPEEGGRDNGIRT